MPRITISINASGEPNDQDLLTLDLPPSLTIADLKGMIEAETRFSTETQTLFFNGQALRSDTQTLEQANINDGEMLAVMVRQKTSNTTTTSSSNTNTTQQGSTPSTAQPQRNNRVAQEADTPDRIEQVRQQILNNPEHLTGLIEQQPELAEVLHDKNKFLQIWSRMLNDRDLAQRHRHEEMKMLNEDPFNPDTQRKIEEMMRREQIEENLQYAIENNPATFGRVSMLYVDVLVNNHPIKAFVDSGAQTTIMSPSCADEVGLSYLIDDRFGGIARGVGTAKILGRIHNAEIQIGDASLDCSFTVMEGKDVDLLFGLDMLRRHQACIDLLANELRFPHTKVQFLPESELPKRLEESMMNEPTVSAPNGLEVGANTGTVRPLGTAQAAANHIQAGESSSSSSAAGKQPLNASSPAASSVGSSSRPTNPTPSQQRHPPPQQQQQQQQQTGGSRWPEASIKTLLDLGFSRQRAIGALDATNGNVDYAASMLMFD